MRSKKLLGTTIMLAVVTVTLAVAPYTLLDPMNQPKMSLLAFFSIVAISIVVPGIKKLFHSGNRNLFVLASLFTSQIILVLFFSRANFGGQFYGTFGRNTGALAYFSLTFLLFSSSLVADKDFVKKFVRMTLILGLILIVYGNIQYLNLEPFPYTNAYTTNAPIGTFGNPDFQSAFMGLIAVMAFTMALNTAFTLTLRVGLTLMGIASIIVVYQTLAKQGYLNFLAGIGVVVLLWLFMTKRKVLAMSAAGVGAVAAVFVFFGLINQGPFASLLYKGSLAARGYYWRAALEMLFEKPAFGVGMDGFNDWYRRSRPEDYFEKGFLSVSNSAHNVYLDIASSGGFPLIVIYMAILGLVVVSIIRVVKRSTGFDVYFAAIVGGWIAYQTQAFVSINQLGLAIWGWVLSGLIIGYEIINRFNEIPETLQMKRKKERKKVSILSQPINSGTLISTIGGVVIGALVAIPPYYVNTSFYSALKSGDMKAIQGAAYLKPLDERRLLLLAIILRDNKLDNEAISVVQDANLGYPDSYDFWQLWASIPSASPREVDYAKGQLKRLDPSNPDF